MNFIRRTHTAIALALLTILLSVAPSVAASTGNTTHWGGNGSFAGNLTVLGTLGITGATTFTGDVTVGGNLAVTGNTTHTGTTGHTGAATFTAAVTHSSTLLQSGVATFTLAPVLSTATITASGDTYTIPDVGNASFVMTAGAQTVAGATTFTLAPVLTSGTLTVGGLTVTVPAATDTLVGKATGDVLTNKTLTNPTINAAALSGTISGSPTFSGTLTLSNAPTITGGLTAANIQTGSAKRQLLRAVMAPAGGAVTVNSTVYFGNLAFGRAGTVKRITYGTAVDPVSGTNTVKVLKNGSAGNTMLSTASVSLNGATANVAQNGTLTATGADLALAATDTVYLEYSAGTQGVVAKDVYGIVEFEPTDF